MDRLTLTAGLRFDYFKTIFRRDDLGPGPHVPNRNFTIPESDLVQLQGPLAAPRRGLRPLRQRQDGGEGAA